MNHLPFDPNHPEQREPDFVLENTRGENAYIHESSYIDTPCQIGRNTEVLHFTHIMPHTIIGESCHIGHNVTIGSGVLIGNRVKVMNNALLNSGVVIEDEVYCGPSTVFAPENRLIGRRNRTISKVSPTIVRHGTTIGANVSITAGITIGQHTFIEAGSVIDNNVPNFALVYGHPFRLAGWRCQCGSMLKFRQRTSECEDCGKQYIRPTTHQVLRVEKPEDEKSATNTAS